MHEATPDPATEELIWFAWPPRSPRPAGQVEPGDELSDLFERPDEEEHPEPGQQHE